MVLLLHVTSSYIQLKKYFPLERPDTFSKAVVDAQDLPTLPFFFLQPSTCYPRSDPTVHLAELSRVVS